ncbi:MAG: PmoA family protein [Planctomycetota bacterium]|nr:PmoA family protein [Planctomycetota bacterium]MDG1984200.1 PmoA family protein [Planctomycetota bacterium]
MQRQDGFTKLTQRANAARLRHLGLALTLALASACQTAATGPPPRVLSAKSHPEAVTIYAGPDLFAELRLGFGERMTVSRLRASNGVDVLRGFPMEPRIGESVDHPEQTGIWAAHGGMNGDDLWYGTGGGVADEHTLRIDSDSVATLITQVEWSNAAGHRICEEQRRVRFEISDDLHLVDFDLALTASADGLVLEDVKEGFFAARLADDLRSSAGAETFGSTGAKGASLWGERARWIASASPTAGGRAATVCIFEDPRNPGHPSRWQVRPYGLVAANPFATGAFTEDPRDDQPAIIDSYGSLRLRYRVVIAPRVLSFTEVDALWARFAQTEPSGAALPSHRP